MSETQKETPLIDPAIVKEKAVEKTSPKADSDAKIPDKGGFVWGTGRRKSSVARVRIKPGSGKLLVNNKKVEDYFRLSADRIAVSAPLVALNVQKSFDVFVNVSGGGTTGQAGAVMLGIARAIRNYDPSCLKALRDGGYLTRDSRMVERKKPGQSGARKKFQFSKR